jgi:hypothetical protein
MNDSSTRRLEKFEKLRIAQVQCLLNILIESTIHGRDFVETAYSERARHFVETVQFLKDLNWVTEQGGNLGLSDAGFEASSLFDDEDEIRVRVTEALVAEPNPYRADVAKYLRGFTISESRLIYRPSMSDRLKESPLRNFLMDARLVTYRATDDTYLLEESGTELYVWAVNFRRPASKEMARSEAEGRDHLGSAAELVVLTYERDRVGAQWAHRVEHVSAMRPFSCYDIKSVTVRGCDTIPRYIEVKAVPSDSYQFYWTKSEVEAAQLLRAKYFLYLLPVRNGRDFDLGRILVLDDPYISVYQSKSDWQIEENVIVCRRTRQT